MIQVAFGLIVRWPELPTLQCALDNTSLTYTSFAHPLGPRAQLDRSALAGARVTVHIYGATYVGARPSTQARVVCIHLYMNQLVTSLSVTQSS